MTTGGRLEIAGVVVGHWGPNCRLVTPQPQVKDVISFSFLIHTSLMVFQIEFKRLAK